MEMFLFPKKNGNWEIWLLREAYIFEGKKQMKSVGSMVGWAGFLLHTQPRHLLHFGMCFPLTKEARQTDPHTGCFNSLWHTLKTSEATVIQIENYATEIIGDLKWLSSKFFKFFGLKWIAEVLNFDDSMPKDTWFPLNFNFLKVEVGYFSWFN